MKRLFVSLMIVFAVGVCFAQTIELMPMTFDDSTVYTLHKSWHQQISVTSVPNWGPSKIPSFIETTPEAVGSVREDRNWIEFKETFNNEYYSLATDDKGNVWVISNSLFGREDIPFFILNKTISKPEDVIGLYWVSWKLIPGTKDIYPVLNPE